MLTLRENEELISQTEPNSSGMYTRVLIRTRPDDKKQRVTQNIQISGVQRVWPYELTGLRPLIQIKRSKHAGWLDNSTGPIISTMKPFGAALLDNTGVTIMDTSEYHFTKGETTRATVATMPLVVTNLKCRNCGGTDHLTFACKMAPLTTATPAAEPEPVSTKYIPPAARKGYVEENRCLRISNLPYSCVEDELRSILEVYGRIERLRVGYDPVEEVCKGWAFVTFVVARSAKDTIEKLNKARYGHNVLDVAWAEMDKPSGR